MAEPLEQQQGDVALGLGEIPARELAVDGDRQPLQGLLGFEPPAIGARLERTQVLPQLVGHHVSCPGVMGEEGEPSQGEHARRDLEQQVQRTVTRLVVADEIGGEEGGDAPEEPYGKEGVKRPPMVDHVPFSQMHRCAGRLEESAPPTRRA